MHPDYPKNIVIRVGEGQSPFGKILDGGTHWYNINEYESAINYAINTNRNIYISINNQKYRKYTINKLKTFIENSSGN